MASYNVTTAIGRYKISVFFPHLVFSGNHPMAFCCREAEYCDLRSGDGFVPLHDMQQPRCLGLKKVG